MNFKLPKLAHGNASASASGEEREGEARYSTQAHAGS